MSNRVFGSLGHVIEWISIRRRRLQSGSASFQVKSLTQKNPKRSSPSVVIHGICQHYKGKRYKVLAVAHHSETLEEMAVYEAQTHAHLVWVRPLDMFCGMVDLDGQQKKRFTLVVE